MTEALNGTDVEAIKTATERLLTAQPVVLPEALRRGVAGGRPGAGDGDATTDAAER